MGEGESRKIIELIREHEQKMGQDGFEPFVSLEYFPPRTEKVRAVWWRGELSASRLNTTERWVLAGLSLTFFFASAYSRCRESRI